MSTLFPRLVVQRIGCALALTLILAGCGGGGGGPDAGPQITRIGATGGTAAGPGGSQASVPAGALTQEVGIGIEASGAGAPPLPTDVTRIGSVHAFTPHGTTFAQPVSVTVPFDLAQWPAGSTPALYKTTTGGTGWAEVPGAVVNGATMVGSVNGFSHFVAVIPPLIKAEPRYEWEFTYYQGNGLGWLFVPNGTGEQVGGVLSELADLGQQPLDLILPLLGQPLPKDGRANGYVFAQGNGVTYGTLAEAPFGALDTTDPIGGGSRLKQWQTFRKESDDARLTFTLTSVVLRLEDYLPPLNRRGEVLLADALLSVGAYLADDRSKYFYIRAGLVTAGGERGDWWFDASNYSWSRGSLWDNSLFELTVEPIAYPSDNVSCVGELARVRFLQPRIYTIDLSSVPTGAEFTVRADVQTRAMNAKGGGDIGDCLGSHAYSYLRDPQEVGGSVLEYSGLLPVPTPSIESPPRDAYEPPASCPGGTAPAAGTVQFGAPAFAVSERAGSPPTILVTRSGGSTGAVSATLATFDGSAVAGTDYQPVLTTVHFGDGDSGTRVVEVPIIPNTLDEADRTVLLALSEPGGCASLGVPSSAVLSIEDDDPPQQTLFTVGGTVTGLAGSGLTIANLSRSQAITGNGSFQLDQPLATGSVYRIEVTVQPQNPRQVCAVGNGAGAVAGANVTDVQITCTTLSETGSLDPAFGSGGRTFIADLGTVVYDTELARQADGKLLVVNGSNRLRRRLSDGTPDASFGTAGDGSVVVTSGQRTAYQVSAVAVQPDGRIVVAGNAPAGALGRPDMLVARYLADGTLDTSFAGGRGIASFDLSTYSDGASQVLVQPDGTILLAGVVGDTSGNGNTSFAVLRLTAGGAIDTSYGLAGLASAGDDIFDVPRAAARTIDGGVVLVGRVATSGGSLADEGIVKFTAAGVPDTSFGVRGDGIVRPRIDGSHEEARDVVVQPDGKIVVLGTTGTFSWLTRYLADGRIDLAFGVQGRAEIPTPVGGWALALQADGSLWVAGGVANDFGLSRFTATGQPDSLFNNGAVLSIDLYGSVDDPAAMLLQPDGRLVVAGRAYNGSTIGLGLVRVLP